MHTGARRQAFRLGASVVGPKACFHIATGGIFTRNFPNVRLEVFTNSPYQTSLWPTCPFFSFFPKGGGQPPAWGILSLFSFFFFDPSCELTENRPLWGAPAIEFQIGSPQCDHRTMPVGCGPAIRSLKTWKSIGRNCAPNFAFGFGQCLWTEKPERKKICKQKYRQIGCQAAHRSSWTTSFPLLVP